MSFGASDSHPPLYTVVDKAVTQILKGVFICLTPGIREILQQIP